jgi:hypothetical protein
MVIESMFNRDFSNPVIPCLLARQAASHEVAPAFAGWRAGISRKLLSNVKRSRSRITCLLQTGARDDFFTTNFFIYNEFFKSFILVNTFKNYYNGRLYQIE